MKKVFFSIAMIGLAISFAMAQQPPQSEGTLAPPDQPQQAPAAKPSPLPSIREQGEAGGQEQRGTEADQKPRSGIPAIREQEEEPRALGKTGRPGGEIPSTLLARPYKASELKGREVKGSTGEDLGKIADVIIGRDGRVEFVLVSYGGFLGIGEKLVAVPYSALRQGPEQDSFLVGIDRKRMEQAPPFQQGQWPDFYSEAWTRDVRSYYGQ